MNKEILNKFVEQMITLLNSGTDFAKAEIPDICRQIIAYKMTMASTGIAMEALFAVFAYKLFINGKREFKEDPGSFPTCGLFALCTIVSLIAFISFCHDFRTLIMTIVAPKLLLLEYFGKLIK